MEETTTIKNAPKTEKGEKTSNTIKNDTVITLNNVVSFLQAPHSFFARIEQGKYYLVVIGAQA